MKKFFYAGLFAILSIVYFISCSHIHKNKSHQTIPESSIKAGKKLAAKYCGSCHLLPDPSLLDAKSWENGVLPEMGPRLGIFYYFRYYPSSKNDSNVNKNYYPSQPVLSYDQWKNILDYYTATSPDSLLPAKKSPPIQINNKFFQPIQTSFKYNMSAITFVKIQPNHQLLICDAIAKKLFVFNQSLQLTDSINTESSVTDILKTHDTLIVCNTGVLNPNNGKFGLVYKIITGEKNYADTLSKNLMRPVQITGADLNDDGKEDYIVCEFGNLEGALSWLENKGNNRYIYHIIRNAPGAIKTYVTDYNHDGLQDLWTLFAQGNESIFLFTNKGNGNFESKQVLQFPPSYGSSSFELDDFNGDGFPDILYTCGDNADYSRVFKPYHGVYIFLNDGKNNFTKKYFYPINGCYKAIARDFDNDGDLDVATISFFADYANHPEEGFVYFKNDGNFKFEPYNLPAAKNGRWLTMDAGDFDGDGKIDLILGNFSLSDKMAKASIDWTQQPAFLVLRNIQ
jgi:hypothetical protein